MTTQEEIMNSCWENPTSRDCSYCRAYHKREGGECCFGLRYEKDDRICQGCPHVHACRIKTIGSTYNKPRPSPTLIPKPKIVKPVRAEREELTAEDDHTEENEEGLTLEHAARRLGYGAVEGACEMFLRTLRYWRPPP